MVVFCGCDSSNGSMLLTFFYGQILCAQSHSLNNSNAVVVVASFFILFFSWKYELFAKMCLFAQIPLCSAKTKRKKRVTCFYIFTSHSKRLSSTESIAFVRMSTVKSISRKCLCWCVLLIFNVRVIIVVSQFRHVTFFISMEIFIHIYNGRLAVSMFIWWFSQKDFFTVHFCVSLFFFFFFFVSAALWKNKISVAPFFYYFTAFFLLFLCSSLEVSMAKHDGCLSNM